MAARKRNWQTNKTREKIRDSIKVGQLVKRLEEHVFSDKSKDDFKEMTQTQIKAAEVLLQRTLPTLSSAEIVEQEKEPGIQDSLDKLAQFLGPELAKILTEKDGLRNLQALVQKSETVIVHEQPDKPQ